MKIAIAALSLAAASAFTPKASPRAFKSTALSMSDEPVKSPVSLSRDVKAEAELKDLAASLNPIIKFYDPLNLAQGEFWGTTQAETIAFLRHSEIKHGRVAMAAFVGYCVQSNFVFPWKLTLEGMDHPATALGPEAQWDALPVEAKWQIISVIGLLEMWGERGTPANPHYMRGGKPGFYPTFDEFRDTVHPVFDLYDPFGFHKKMTEQKKAKGLVAEINNGRLAMIGIMGFLCADATEGSVPALVDIAIPYNGNLMDPFAV